MRSPIQLLTLGLLAVSLAGAVAAVPATTPTDDGKGGSSVPAGIRCGLGKDFHAGRRAALLDTVEEGVFVFRGLPETRGYTPFHQDKVFWYLTGVESPNAALVMDKASGRQVLFLPEIPEWQEMWEGEFWDVGDEWISQVTGIAEVRPTREMLDVLTEMTGEQKTVYTAQHPHLALSDCYDRAVPFNRRRAKDPLDGRLSREKALEEQLETRLGVKVKTCTPQINELRRVKLPEEIAAMREAARLGAEAMNEAMRSTKAGLGEWELDALMTFVHRKLGATGPAYHAIVGGGANSLILHYSASNRRLGGGEVVLIDYSPEVEHYTCDITRTWPVDGVFTERMAELYDAVKDSQAAGIAAAKPGAMLADVEKACATVLRERGFSQYIRHASCHYIGMEVHDVGAANKALEPGVAFTIEPGLYDAETNIGIRIEDVVVITEDGCENLSEGTPRDRAAIETLMKESGVLDLMETAGR